MPSDYEFRKVLLKVANGLSKTDYERLLFLLDDDIPKPKQEESIVAVFNHLISVGLISDGDTTYLQNSLREIGFIKLAFELARYDNSNRLLLSYDLFDGCIFRISKSVHLEKCYPQRQQQQRVLNQKILLPYQILYQLIVPVK